ncbi:hypothetical protein BJV82DRAFT_310053 [Fennellomyces sp. T-0311]|nr:hypothetical protein BJV82DRAFT_310053 [Fennellomyces sp. T-0311]
MDSKAEKQEVISSIVGNTIRGDATVSCNTATTIPTSSSRNNGNTDSDGIRKKRLRMRGPKPLYEFISSTADDPKWEIQGKNAATLFATYQAQAAEKQLYLECDVQKILSLSNMLMPEPKQQNTLGVSIFGSGTLKAAHSKFLLRLGFDKSSTNQRNNAKSSLLNIVEVLYNNCISQRSK